MTSRLAAGEPGLLNRSVAFPKVNVATQVSLKPVLAGLGMGVAFSPSADFTGLSKPRLDARRHLPRGGRGQHRDGRRRHRRGGVVEVAWAWAGDIVFGDTGWQDYAAVPAKHLSKMPRMEPMTHLLSVYGIAGLTAYFGLLDVGKPKAGETVVVSAAAGSVGSIVGQIAKIKGCHVVGIAGGADKCHWLTSELGFDAAVDYKDGAVFKALRAAAPKGIDVYFDNVGGDILEACLAQMNNRGRIACCGAISQYDGTPSAHGPRGVPGLIVVKRLIMQGFIVMDYMDARDKALAELQSWV